MPLTALVVEDDTADRELLAYAFKEAGLAADLWAASDGEQAVAMLKQRRPELMLLDLKLPRLSGFEVLEWARSQPDLKTLPIVVLTSSQESRDIERAYALGANSYLAKTAQLDKMIEVVKGIGEYARLLRKTSKPQAASTQAGGFF